MRKFVIALCTLFLAISTFAADYFTYDGYYVDRLISNTSYIFIQKHLLKQDSSTAQDWQKYKMAAENQQEAGILPATQFMYFDESLANYCLEKHFITTEEATSAVVKSQNVGGLVVNGYNLLYLHAALLWDLVVNKHLTKEEALSILDTARKRD